MRSEDWDRKYAEREHPRTDPSLLLVAEVGELPPGRALDLACGEGRNALWLAARGWQVRGVDFSSVAIARARERAAREGLAADFVLADVLEYEPEPAAFDLVLVLYLQLPTPERRLVLRRAAAALRPGGTFLLVAHDLRNATEGVGGPSDPAVLTTPEGVAAELTGLELEKAERVLRPVEGAERPAIDTLVRARRPALAAARAGSAPAPRRRRAETGGSRGR